MKIAGIFFFVLMLLIWSAAGYGQIDESMILALSFDEGGGKVAKDSSLYGNNGSVDGAKWTKDGRFNGALEFDGVGTNVVVVPDSEELRLLEGGTLMAWSHIWTEAGHASWPRIMIKSSDNGGTTNGYDFIFDRANAYALRLCVVACNSFPAVPVETDSWHHVALTFDGSIVVAYVDGEQAGDEIPQPGATVDTTGIDLHIGNGADFARAFHGMHDEVRIFNRALDEDEIRYQMQRSTNDIIAVQPNSKLATTWADIKAD
jgi:hypothetical protein